MLESIIIGISVLLYCLSILGTVLHDNSQYTFMHVFVILYIIGLSYISPWNVKMADLTRLYILSMQY
jgi:hypothetical protein